MEYDVKKKKLISSYVTMPYTLELKIRSYILRAWRARFSALLELSPFQPLLNW